MSAALFTCPECDTTLRGAEKVPAGKKVRCPSCSAVFVMPDWKGVATSDAIRDKPMPNLPSRPARDDGENSDEEAPRAKRRSRGEEDTDRPSRTARASADTEVVSEKYVDEEAREEDDYDDRPRKKKRKKKKAKSGKGLMIGLIAGGVAGVAGIVLLLWLFVFSGSNADADPYTFVNSDANFIAGGDVASIMNDAIFGPLLERLIAQAGNDNPIADCKRETGLEFKELFAQVALGVKADFGGGVNPFGGMAGFGGGKPPPVCFVSKSSKPFDPNKLANAFKGAAAKKLKGKTYYEYTIPGQGLLYIYMPSNRHLVVTNVNETQFATILGASKGKPALSSDTVTLIRAMAKDTVWFAMPLEGKLRDAMQQMAKQQAAAGMPVSGGMDKAKAFGFSAHLDASTFRIAAYILHPDSSSASQLVKQTESDLAKQKTNLGMLDLFLGQFPKSKQAIIDLVESFKVRSDGAILIASGQISRATFNDVAQELQGQLGNFQAGGFGPNAGGIGGGGFPQDGQGGGQPKDGGQKGGGQKGGGPKGGGKKGGGGGFPRGGKGN
jgi:hypothetical protein